MKLGDKLEQLKAHEKDLDKYIEYTVVGSMIRSMEEQILGLRDDEISLKFSEILKRIDNKRKELWHKEIEDSGANEKKLIEIDNKLNNIMQDVKKIKSSVTKIEQYIIP